MRTDELIAQLAADPRAVPRAGRRLAVAMIAGMLLAVVGLALVFGAPLQAVPATGSAALAMKLGYAVSIAIVATLALLAAGRPGHGVKAHLLALALPVVVIAFVSGLELSTAAAEARYQLMIGSSYFHCVAAVALGGGAAFVIVMIAFRVLAPTNLPLAGSLAGLSGGAAGATAFSLYCPEASATFLLTAYTPAMLAIALLGAALGRWLLRW